jgi:protein-S-isoprenylcysteine O-methyltransferase Ste14
MDLSIESQIWLSGISVLVGGGIILPIVRREYLRHGGLSQPVAALQLVVWFLYNMFLALAVWRERWDYLPAYVPGNWFGAASLLLGLALCVAGMVAFHSMTRVTGREAGQLVISGVYRWTRNPQYLGYGLVVLGFVLGYPSSTGWLALPAYALLVYATVRIEEEHLTQVFGEQYNAYCRRVPRFIGLPGPGIPGSS